MKNIVFRTFVVTVLFLLPFSCMFRSKIYRDSRISMDTEVTINVVSSSRGKARIAVNKAFGELEKLSSLLNLFSETSEVAMINKNAGVKPVPVSPETLDLVAKAVEVSAFTGGAFDPTIGVVSTLWDFNAGIKPDAKDIKKLLPLVSYKNITIDRGKGTVFLKKKGMMLDLGGIAKGYGADKAIEILKESGMSAALISVAGDIRAYGTKPDGSSWMIGIRDPRPESPRHNILAALPLDNRAISTSGDYQRFFEKEGTRYHHLLVPSTGMPASAGQSVSVIADTAVMTDALSTAVFIMGPKKGMSLLEDKGYDGVIVDSYGGLHITETLKDSIEIKRPQNKDYRG